MQYSKVVVPSQGSRIEYQGGQPVTPDQPIIPFVRGDGTGPDIWAATQPVLDAAVRTSYGGRRAIQWMEVYAGDKAQELYGEYLPRETLDVLRHFAVAIKGPLTTPVGGGIRSLNVALRQEFDLYACIRPVRYFEGVPSPVKEPQNVDIVIFRENTEDVYAGLEWRAGSPEAEKLRVFLHDELGKTVRPDAGTGHQAYIQDGQPAPGAPGHPVCPGSRARQRDHRPQGQHHEVHRGGLPRLGL